MAVSAVQERIDRISALDNFLSHNKKYENYFAETYGIHNIYKDSNLQQLQQALYLGLAFQPSRQSVDAIDCYGHPWELKSLNIKNKKREFCTSNPMSLSVLGRYASCHFAFSFYEDSELRQIYVMPSSALTPLIHRWSMMIKAGGGRGLNNPKIPVDFVLENGYLAYDSSSDLYKYTALNCAEMLHDIDTSNTGDVI